MRMLWALIFALLAFPVNAQESSIPDDMARCCAQLAAAAIGSRDLLGDLPSRPILTMRA